MKKSNKVYEVTLGYIEEDGNDLANWSSKKIVAIDVLDAIKNVKLKKQEYYSEVKLITVLDE